MYCRALSFLAMTLLFCGSASGQISSYHIGNSLTWDTQPHAFADFAEQRSTTHEVGYHIRCSKSLPYIVANPTETCVDPTETGKWQEALSGHAWDVVTLQIHPSDDSTLGEDLAAALTLIDTARSNPANADTRFILYGPWPLTWQNSAEAWTRSIQPMTLNTPTSHTRAYQRALYGYVAAARPQVSIDFLSIGELLHLADQRIQQEVAGGGDWLGLTDVDELYRDTIHMGGAQGRWLASLAMWSAVTGEDPRGLVKPAGLFGGDASSVLVTDTALRDGLAAFVAESLPAIQTAPEPGSALLITGLGVALLGRHRHNCGQVK